MRNFISGLSSLLKGKRTYLALIGLGLTGIFYPQIESSLGVELTKALVTTLAGLAGLGRYLATKDNQDAN